MISTEVLVLNAPRLLAGAMMLGLAVWVLATDFWSRLFRTFAVFLTLRGGLNLVLPFATGSASEGTLNHFSYIVPYFQIAVPFAAIAFVLRLHDRHDERRSTIWGLAGLLAITVVLELIYFFDHGTYFGKAGGNWLFITISLGDLAYVAAGHMMLRHAEDRRFLLAGIGFLLFPMFAGGIEIALLSRWVEIDRRFLYESAQSWFFVFIRIAAVVYAAVVLWRYRRLPGARAGAIVAWTAFLTGLAWAPLNYAGVRPWQFSFVMNGLWTAAMPVAVGHALLRDHLPASFQSLSRSSWMLATVGLLLTAAMFVSMQGLRETGILLGVVAVTMLAVFALGNVDGLTRPEMREQD